MRRHNLSSHPLYSVWEGMIARCNNKNTDNYKHYGGRGISVCEEWRFNFKDFYDWAIKNNWKKGLKIDRENNELDYTTSNCRVVTQKVNLNNTRSNVFIEFNGERKTLTQWAETFGIHPKTLSNRLSRANLPFEKAIKFKKFETEKNKRGSSERNSLGQFSRHVSLVHGTEIRRQDTDARQRT